MNKLHFIISIVILLATTVQGQLQIAVRGGEVEVADWIVESRVDLDTAIKGTGGEGGTGVSGGGVSLGTG